MDDDLLEYYESELRYLRRMGAEFAERHPQAAGRLGMGGDDVEDPHVRRLIESAAFLNARVRQKLDDGFPEITDALLTALHPHYLAPIPSMSIVCFEPNDDAKGTVEVKAGTVILTDRQHGHPCSFRTTQDVDVPPIRIAEAELVPVPFVAPRTPRSATSKAVLRIAFAAPEGQGAFDELVGDRFRFFLRGGARIPFLLLELLMTHGVEVALASSSHDGRPSVLPPGSIRSVGFEPDQGLLPSPPASPTGHRLLTEYFAFPAKFLFFDVVGFDRAKLAETRDRLELFVYFDETVDALCEHVDASSFALGCAPVINLFDRRAEPEILSGRQSELRLVPDARRPLAYEVHSIRSVESSSMATGERISYRPIHAAVRGGADQSPHYWHSTRRDARGSSDSDGGTEVFLQLVDLDFQPAAPMESVLNAEISCTNRDLPTQLPFGANLPVLKVEDGSVPVAGARFLMKPTAPIRPPRGDAARWRLISHLSLNHIALQSSAGVQVLQGMLRLYDFVYGSEGARDIDAIRELRSRMVDRRVIVGGRPGFCRGLRVEIVFDADAFERRGLYVLASVLERFLALNTSVNSFVEFVATTRARDDDESESVVRHWKPRAGWIPLA